ncbi:MAG: hypothetical protein HUU20_28170 [Pirellulales bacterium]|nr:hypothetical protein [Pirellulales bacterium]
MKSPSAIALCLLLTCAASLALAADARPKLTGLLQNEDCTNFFYFQDFPAGKAGEMTDRYVDILAGAGVSVLMCNTNARRTNYRSDVWEAFWDGYDPDGPDDQPFLAGVPKDEVKTYRKLIGNMLAVHQQGVDYPARTIARCRHHGISPWISLRMNDVHYNDNLDHPFHAAFWRKPELFRTGYSGYFARALDYAHPEVRDRYRALIAETLARYDVDGIELDFMREPYLFSKGKEQEGKPLLTQWLTEVRRLADAAAARRKHPVLIGVRVPSKPETALALGLDAAAWAKLGLVDLVVAAPRWATLQYDLPLAEWRRLLGDRVTLAGGLEIRYEPYPGAPSLRMVDSEDAAGAAVSVLSGGADVVYLFNYFQHGHPHWSTSEYQRVLKTFSSLDDLLKMPRRHAVTYRDVVASDEAYQPPLPAGGTKFSFPLPLGPKPPAGWKAEALIEEAAAGASSAAPAVFVNQIAAEPRSNETTKSGTRLLTYSIPAEALRGENRDTITVSREENTPTKILRVEVRLYPG